MSDPHKAKAIKRWREQGLNEEQIADKIANWGTPGKPFANLVPVDTTNPYTEMPQDRLRSIQRELRKEASALRVRTARVSNALDMVRRALVENEPPPISVSEHAILRYVERKLGIDTEAIREEIRAAVAGYPADEGSRFVDVGDVKYVVAQSVVQSLVEESDGQFRHGVSRNLSKVVTTLSAEMTTSEIQEAELAMRGKLGEEEADG